MNDVSINDLRDFRLRQLEVEFEGVKNALETYEFPFITGNSLPTLAQLERAERSLHRLMLIRAGIDELKNLK